MFGKPRSQFNRPMATSPLKMHDLGHQKENLQVKYLDIEIVTYQEEKHSSL